MKPSSDSSKLSDLELRPLELLEVPCTDVSVVHEIDSPPKTLVSSFCPKIIPSCQKKTASGRWVPEAYSLYRDSLCLCFCCEGVAH